MDQQGTIDLWYPRWFDDFWFEQTCQNQWAYPTDARHWTVGDFTVGDYCLPPFKIENEEALDVTRLGKMKNELEGEAWTELQTALKMATQQEVSTDLSTCIERAVFFFDYNGIDHTPRGAVDALKEVTQAVGMSKFRSELYWKLKAAEWKVRDSLTVRTVLASGTLSNRKKYHSVLEEAYGGKIDDEENSRLMQSFRKTIWEKFDGAFPSNNKKENLQRGGPRPRRERPGRPARPPPAEEPPNSVAMAIRPPPGLHDF